MKPPPGQLFEAKASIDVDPLIRRMAVGALVAPSTTTKQTNNGNKEIIDYIFAANDTKENCVINILVVMMPLSCESTFFPSDAA